MPTPPVKLKTPKGCKYRSLTVDWDFTGSTKKSEKNNNIKLANVRFMRYCQTDQQNLITGC